MSNEYIEDANYVYRDNEVHISTIHSRLIDSNFSNYNLSNSLTKHIDLELTVFDFFKINNLINNDNKDFSLYLNCLEKKDDYDLYPLELYNTKTSSYINVLKEYSETYLTNIDYDEIDTSEYFSYKNSSDKLTELELDKYNILISKLLSNDGINVSYCVYILNDITEANFYSLDFIQTGETQISSSKNKLFFLKNMSNQMLQ